MTSPARLESVRAGDGFTSIDVATDKVGVGVGQSVDRGQGDMSTYVIPTQGNEHTTATTTEVNHLKLFGDYFSLISST